MNWYVVFVKTGKEKESVMDLRMKLGNQDYFPFVPMKEILFKKAGIVRREREVLFPGYIFVETDRNRMACPSELSEAVKKSSFCHRVLNYGSYECAAMCEEERQMLCSFMNNDDLIEVSEAFLVGDRVQVISGALKGYENRIISFNRHKRTAVIELYLMGRKTNVTVALNTLRKLPDEEFKEGLDEKNMQKI